MLTFMAAVLPQVTPAAESGESISWCAQKNLGARPRQSKADADRSTAAGFHSSNGSVNFAHQCTDNACAASECSSTPQLS